MHGVQRAVTQAGGYGDLFNGHSFRIAAATSANPAGIPETIIKILIWWQSSAYQATSVRQSQHWQLSHQGW